MKSIRLITLSLWLLGTPAFGQGALSASLDYSMPERLTEQSVQSFLSGRSVNPSKWRVDFNACGSGGSPTSYRLAVDGSTVNSTSCRFSHRFDKEGSFRATLEIEDAAGNKASTTKNVVVQDWLVIGLGDSYASGEGNPDRPIASEYWDEVEKARADLRSAHANLTQAQKKLGSVLRALGTWNSACFPLPTFACPSASSALITELSHFGINGAAALLLNGFRAVKAEVDSTITDLKAADAAASAALSRLIDNPQANDPRFEAEWMASGHRSVWSGQVQAALEIEQADPRTSVTFLHLANSGAVIGDLLGKDGQIAAAKKLIGNREIDAIVMSIGGNDVNFGPAVKACMWQAECHKPGPPVIDAQWPVIKTTACAAFTQLGGDVFVCLSKFDEMKTNFSSFSDPSQSASDLFLKGFGTLDGKYAGLQSEIGSRFPGLDASRVYITEYPDSTRNSAGAICSDVLGIPGLSPAEGAWASHTVIPKLNGSVASNAMTHGWRYIGGISGEYRRHGYCVPGAGHWVVRLEESLMMQNDLVGAVHPNKAGHRVYSDKISAALLDDFYVNGVPRSQ